jgi:hypothetical protein
MTSPSRNHSTGKLTLLLGLLDGAVKAVPAAKYLWGAVGLSGVVAIISLVNGLTRLTFVAMMAAFIAMVLFYVFSRIGKTTDPIIGLLGYAILVMAILAFIFVITTSAWLAVTCEPRVFAYLYGVSEVCHGSTGPDAMRGKENLPGFSTSIVFQPNDLNERRRKYYFAFEDPEHAQAILYLSASNIFTFSVTDVNGERYPLEIPLGSSDGIPINQFVVAVFEVGVATNYAFMRAVINGREVAHRSLFPIDLGSRKWLPKFLGADEHGQNPGPMLWMETAAFFTTQTDAQINALFRNQQAAFGIGK